MTNITVEYAVLPVRTTALDILAKITNPFGSKIMLVQIPGNSRNNLTSALEKALKDTTNLEADSSFSFKECNVTLSTK